MTIGSNTKTFFIVTSRTGQPPIDLSLSLSGWSPICSIRGVFMHAEYTERTWALGNPIICQRPDEIVVLCLLWIQHWTWSSIDHRNYRLDKTIIHWSSWWGKPFWKRWPLRAEVGFQGGLLVAVAAPCLGQRSKFICFILLLTLFYFLLCLIICFWLPLHLLVWAMINDSLPHTSVQWFPLLFNPIKIAIIIIDNEDRCPPITENWDQADLSSGMATRSSKPPQTN